MLVLCCSAMMWQCSGVIIEGKNSSILYLYLLDERKQCIEGYSTYSDH